VGVRTGWGADADEVQGAQRTGRYWARHWAGEVRLGVVETVRGGVLQGLWAALRRGALRRA